MVAFAAATALASVLYHLQGVPFIKANLHALVAAMFLLVPMLVLRRRGRDLEEHGFTTRPVKLGVIVTLVGIFGVLPLFVGGFWIYNRAICAWAPQLASGSCWHVLHPTLRLPGEYAQPWDFAKLAAAQLIVVGLPEELFFRGYVQGSLEQVWPPSRRLFGAKLGLAWLVAAVLFGLGHFFVTFEPQMLTRFFPGLLFGWMYARTRSILAGTIFHAACNLLMDVLIASFLT